MIIDYAKFCLSISDLKLCVPAQRAVIKAADDAEISVASVLSCENCSIDNCAMYRGWINGDHEYFKKEKHDFYCKYHSKLTKGI